LRWFYRPWSVISKEARILAQNLPEELSSSPLTQIPLPSWLDPVRVRIASAVDERLSEIGHNALPSRHVRVLVILAAVTFICYFALLTLTGAP